jgi:RND family efflux transporter MFP subunit
MNRWIKRIVWTVVAVAVVAGGAFVIHKKKVAIEHLPPPPASPYPVLTATVRTGSVSEEIRTVALVQSDRSAQIAAQVSGVILDCRVREGDSVKKGMVLARIDPRTLDDAVEAARARLAAAEEELRRVEAVFARDKALFEGNAISRQTFELSRAQLESARSARISAQQALDTAKTLRTYANVVSPFDGRVTARFVDPGDLASPGKVLFTMEAPGTVRLISKLSQDQLARLKPGDEAVFFDSGRTERGKITRIYPALDPTHLGVVETLLDRSPFGLPAGATVAVTYITEPVEGLFVPFTAILQGINETLVILVQDGQAKPVPVQVVRRGTKEVAVQGDIASGDVVVTGPPSELMWLAASRPKVVANATSQR